MLLNKNNKEQEIIKKSKENIKKEKEKIKKAKATIKEKRTAKLGKFFKKNKIEEKGVTKSQIFTMIYFTIIGFALCLLALYALSGGRNYFKLYHELNKFIDTYDTITSNYYGDLSKKQLVDNAISSMLESIGDDYTTYTDVNNTNEFNENIEGTYEGIGCTVTIDEDSNIIVSSVFENSPASNAGLQENDIIIKVDGEDYTKKTSTDVAEYIKGSTKSSIKMTIIRNKEEKELTIKRSKIELPTVTKETYKEDNKTIGYLKISLFTSVTTEQFKEKLQELEKEKIDGLIIDVRDNSGGYLSTVTDITSMFLKKNQVIYQLQNDNKTTIKKDTTKEHREYPVIVLINKNSASASEILASAILESYGGEVVGVNSYGKGTVQKTKNLSDGSMIKYTVQKWLTPNGKWLNQTGLTPTKYVELNLDSEEDNQLQEAIKIIKTKTS